MSMLRRSPEQISHFFDLHQHELDCPESWYGDEPNTVKKDWDLVDFKVLVSAPMPYTQFVGNHSIPLLYYYFNMKDGWLADRAFYYNSHREHKLFMKAGIPLFGLEHRRPAADFHLITHSINYTAQLASTVQMLKVAGIPRRATKRAEMLEPYPMLWAGSNIVGNPIVINPIFDVVWLGDLEDEKNNPGMWAVGDVIVDYIKAGDYFTKAGREDLLHTLASRFSFIYVPHFYTELRSGSNRKLFGWELKYQDVPAPAKKRWVRNLDDVPGLSRTPLSYFESEGMACQPVGEPVWTKRGVVPIEATVVGDHSIGAVLETYCRWTTDELIELKTSAFPPILFTPNHPIFVSDSNAHGLEKANAEDVVPADWVHVPMDWTEEVPDLLYPVDENLMIVIAQYLADGSPGTGKGPIKRLIQTGFGARSRQTKLQPYLEAVKALGFKPSVAEQRCGEIISVRIYGRQFTEWMVEQFGKGALGKRIPGWMHRLPNHLIEIFLDHYPDGTTQHGHHCWTSCNRLLITSIALLAMKIGRYGRICSKQAGFGSPNRVFLYEHLPMGRATKRISGELLVRVSSVRHIKTDRPVQVFNMHTDHGLYAAPFVTKQSGECEASRGCAGHCCFCASTFRYAPFRIRSADKMVELFKENVRNTGAMNTAPLTLEWGTHPLKKQVMLRVLQEVCDDISAPSLRIDNFAEDPGFAQLMARGGKDQVTLAVEGTSQRLRTAMSKGITTAMILDACQIAMAAGMKRIKIYMIADLPGEGTADTLEVLQLAESLNVIRKNLSSKCQIRFSFCVAGNTLLTTSSYGMIEIGSLVNYTTEPGWHNIDPVTIITHEGPTEVDKVFVSGPQDLIRLRTRGGVIEGTPDHPVAVIKRVPNGWEAIWKPLRDVAESDNVLYSAGVADDTRIATQESIEEAWLWGYWFGDGTKAKAGVVSWSFAEGQEEAVECATSILTRMGYKPTLDHHPEIKMYTLRVCRRALYDVAPDPYQRHIPSSILSAPKVVQLAFVGGFFDADGTVRMGYPYIDQVRPRLVEQLQTLLWSVGLANTATVEVPDDGYLHGGKRQPIWHVKIDEPSVFLDLVKTHLQYKRSRIVQKREYRGIRVNAAYARPVIEKTTVPAQTTYDFTIEPYHQWIANGAISSNTPLNVQANTPLQWTPINLDRKELGQIYHPLKALGMDFTLGKKAEANLKYFVQLCELADNDAAEAILDVCEHLDIGYLGGMQRDTKALLVSALFKRGRDLGYYFREKERDELFAWDIIDLRIQKKYLLRLYDELMLFLASGQPYAEGARRPGYLKWGTKCNEECTACGACDALQLQTIKSWKTVQDDEIRLSDVTPIDQVSYRQVARFKLWIEPKYRFVPNNHWRSQIRRAFNLVDIPIAKRSVRLVSDVLKYRNWVAGTDYVEVGLQQLMLQSRNDVNNLIARLNPNLVGCQFVDGDFFGRDISKLVQRTHQHYYTINADRKPAELAASVAKFFQADYFPVKLKKDVYQKGLVTEEVNLHDYAADLWVTQEGQDVKLHMILVADMSPYEVLRAIAPALAKAVYRHPAVKIDTFLQVDESQDDFFRPTCVATGRPIPTNILGRPFDASYSPKALSKVNGILVES